MCSVWKSSLHLDNNCRDAAEIGGSFAANFDETSLAVRRRQSRLLGFEPYRVTVSADPDREELRACDDPISFARERDSPGVVQVAIERSLTLETEELNLVRATIYAIGVKTLEDGAAVVGHQCEHAVLIPAQAGFLTVDRP